MIAATFVLAASLLQKPNLAKIAAAADGKVGMAALVLETNESLALNAYEKFPMQSVYKVPIAMTVLRDVDRNRLKLGASFRVHQRDLVPAAAHSPMRDAHPQGDFDITLRELLRLAIAESDGSASDLLLEIAGGPAAVNSFLNSVGVNGMNVETTERAMALGDETVQYRNWATPNGAIQVLRALVEVKGLSKASRELILGDMAASTPGAKRIKGELPPGTPVAHKTGTSATKGGMTRATNDIGIIQLASGRHLLVAVFVSDSRATESVREATIAKLARAAYDYFR